MVSPPPMETHLSRIWVFATFQNFAPNSLDSWMETGSIITLPQFNPLIIFSPPPTLCQCLLFIYSLPPLLSFLFFDNLISQICDCHREMSHCFQPFQPPLPSSHPVLPPPFSSPPFLVLFPLSVDGLWVATVSWDTVSSLTLTPGKLLHLASQPQLCCRLLLCHLSVSISSCCCRGFAVASAI